MQENQIVQIEHGKRKIVVEQKRVTEKSVEQKSKTRESMKDDEIGIEIEERGHTKVKQNKCLGVETRRQRKAKDEPLKPLRVAEEVDEEITVSDVKTLQHADVSLSKYFEIARERRDPRQKGHNQYWYEEEDGVLYRIFQCLKPGQLSEIKQLVVPKDLRERVLKLAHQSILAGHMGVKKTLDRILSNFHWPGIQGDVVRFCRSCDVCQKTIPKGKIGKIPLGQMPLIDEPFKRIAIDLVGPIYPVSEKEIGIS